MVPPSWRDGVRTRTPNETPGSWGELDGDGRTYGAEAITGTMQVMYIVTNIDAQGYCLPLTPHLPRHGIAETWASENFLSLDQLSVNKMVYL